MHQITLIKWIGIHIDFKESAGSLLALKVRHYVSFLSATQQCGTGAARLATPPNYCEALLQSSHQKKTCFCNCFCQCSMWYVLSPME